MPVGSAVSSLSVSGSDFGVAEQDATDKIRARLARQARLRRPGGVGDLARGEQVSGHLGGRQLAPGRLARPSRPSHRQSSYAATEREPLAWMREIALPR